MTITSIDPATEETLQTFEPMTREEALDAVGRAHGAFEDWRRTTFDERKANMLRFAEILRENEQELGELIVHEMGKRIAEAKYEIRYCADIATFYANGAEEFLSDRPMERVDANAYVRCEPIGALLGVMPWNFPFYQVIRFAAPNLMAGNTILVKHAGIVPQCARRIEELFGRAGFPDGVYQNLLIPTEFCDTIIADDRIAGVSLTGSEAAGAAVASTAGKNLKRSVLELGGNDAFIVLEDADLQHTIEQAVKGRLVNNGQSCVAAKRFIVVDALYDAFVDGLKKAFEDLRVGDPMDEDTDLGPLSSEDAAQRLAEQVKSTIDAGATVVCGGGRPDRKGAFFEPTILTDVTKDMPTYDQELFGPVATVYRVRDEEAAIELANDSSYGLGGSVFTRDVERGRRVAERVETGMMFVNQPTRSQAELPFGGIKNSGYGRELSHLGILEFVNKKLVHLGK